VLTPPDGLSDAALASALRRGWAVPVASIGYRAVGFGSHHWEVTDTAGTRWFVTADDLETRRQSLGEPPSAAFGRLRAALRAARDLRDCGCAFVVAPVRASDGEPLARAGDRFGLALYPFVDGQSFAWGEFCTPAHRRAVLELVIAVHTAPGAAARHAEADDFALPHRDELEAALGCADDPGDVAGCGPYARPAALLLAANRVPIRRLLARYDVLVSESRGQPCRAVLTHGEPHPGNTMQAAGGWVLIDWDTALVAPPERDLWSLDPGDGSILSGYAAATGVTPRASLLELYRIRWDLADLAVFVSRFRSHHAGGADDDKSWQALRGLIARISG
jgi:Phosphotransferase enzyme family